MTIDLSKGEDWGDVEEKAEEKEIENIKEMIKERERQFEEKSKENREIREKNWPDNAEAEPEWKSRVKVPRNADWNDYLNYPEDHMHDSIQDPIMDRAGQGLNGQQGFPCDRFCRYRDPKCDDSG